MANIWRKDDNYREKPSRNVVDLSFQNNGTYEFGKLYPVLIQPTIPGDSYSVRPTFALNFAPMVFPIQTRMRAYLHFFKVRNRNLWKDWEDFIGKNKQGLEVPYIDESVTQARTGLLLDYLGVPTTIVGAYGNTLLEATAIFQDKYVGSSSGSSYAYNSNNAWGTQLDFTNGSWTREYFGPTKSDNINIPSTVELAKSYPSLASLSSQQSNGNAFLSLYELSEVVNAGGSVRVDLSTHYSSAPSPYVSWLDYMNTKSVSTGTYAPASLPAPYEYYTLALYDSNGDYVGLVSPSKEYQQSHLMYTIPYDDIKYVMIVLCNGVSTITNDEVSVNPIVGEDYDPYLSPSVVGSPLDAVVDIDESNSPYWRSGATTDLRERIKLRALRPRAYEAIYNSFYRNAENNPYILNGKPEYNKYIPTDEGGLDSNLYELRSRNWEDDFLTTALPMPQAGIAPLVGLTGTAGTAVVTMQNVNGEKVVANAQVDEDGNITSLTTEHTSDLAASLLDTVTYGISINDLRNVNAFQRWLEAKARGGYKYRDQIETLFGVTVRYDTLDMPEFIGGMSLDIFVNQISQTTPTADSALGDVGGQASCVGTGDTITEYCDEHGYIIGILSIVPVPNYSQLLDKDWFKDDAFDYYFPQFGHIGMQPITYKEVCPIQAYQESTETDNVLEDTFGYQRAWYDYLARVDEVHGEFRTNLKDFVMNRTFDVKPELSESFLTVDNEQLNDVFAITSTDYAKIRGQIYFDMKAKRPIPLYGIPRLE